MKYNFEVVITIGMFFPIKKKIKTIVYSDKNSLETYSDFRNMLLERLNGNAFSIINSKGKVFIFDRMEIKKIEIRLSDKDYKSKEYGETLELNELNEEDT